MKKPIYCIVCQSESDICVESAWTSGKKAKLHLMELEAENNPLEEYTPLYYLNTTYLST